MPPKTAAGKFIAEIQEYIGSDYKYAKDLFDRTLELEDVSNLIWKEALNLEAEDVLQTAISNTPVGDA